MNKRNFKNLPPRQFPEQQYSKLTHKMGLCVVLPILVILLGGSVGTTYYHYHQKAQRHTYRTVHKPVAKKKRQPKRVKRPRPLKRISVKQGEHLLGHWLRKLNYPAAKAQSILSAYQKQNENQEFKTSQTLNRLTHSPVNGQAKAQQIRHFINKI